MPRTGPETMFPARPKAFENGSITGLSPRQIAKGFWPPPRRVKSPFRVGLYPWHLALTRAERNMESNSRSGTKELNPGNEFQCEIVTVTGKSDVANSERFLPAFLPR
jgi:hypothetical protein